MGIWRGRRDPAVASSTTAQPAPTVVRPILSPRVVWRSGLVLLAVVALGAFGRFVLNDAGSALFTILMAWFAPITMEPAIPPLTPPPPRGQGPPPALSGAGRAPGHGAGRGLPRCVRARVRPAAPRPDRAAPEGAARAAR